jgi:hypothetical protein
MHFRRVSKRTITIAGAAVLAIGGGPAVFAESQIDANDASVLAVGDDD